jgi:hypothetical protein
VQKRGTWDPADLGAKVKGELAKGLTKKEAIAEVFRALKQ